MMISSTFKLTIGKNYTEKNEDETGKFENLGEIIPHYSYIVIREVTKKEFIEFIYETFEKNLADRIDDSAPYFFEIQTD